MERHFTTSVYVFNPRTKRFLFIKNSQEGEWHQPERDLVLNELPDMAAKKCVHESAGIEVYLTGDLLPSENDETRPYGIQRNIIIENKHEHLSLVYLGIPEKQDINETNGLTGNNQITWLTIQDILSTDYNIGNNQKKWCLYFSSMLK